ncbi:glycosyltransferase family 4 protein [Spirillospora sp. CA-128828]|uniref:glycosyltransferase family 4 protein n=1 Tax=Spirillospora sp. CA-128828 TaxID=3240033 RepID=UPI003D8E8FFC
MRSQTGVPGRAGVPGGQIGMIQIARALPSLGAQVKLFVGGPRMAYFAGLDDLDPSYLRWPTWLDTAIAAAPGGVRTIGRRLRRRRWLAAVTALPGLADADVIHVQGLEDAEALIGRVSGPIVVTHWGRVGRWLPTGTDPRADELLAQRLGRIRANAKIVAIGQAQARALADADLPPSAVIPPGIDLQHFTPGDRDDARGMLGLPSDDKIVLYVGRLAGDKNVETVLTAFAGIRGKVRNSRLLIVGDGPTRQDLQSASIRLGIDESVSFLRFVPHHRLPAYYQAADVTVVPSNLLETFCMVALEAIACGCPLIVTDQVPEILNDFPDVPSVSPYDVAGYQEQLVTALAGRLPPADDARVGEYAWSGIARKYADLYQTAHRRGSGHVTGR